MPPIVTRLNVAVCTESSQLMGVRVNSVIVSVVSAVMEPTIRVARSKCFMIYPFCRGTR